MKDWDDSANRLCTGHRATAAPRERIMQCPACEAEEATTAMIWTTCSICAATFHVRTGKIIKLINGEET